MEDAVKDNPGTSRTTTEVEVLFADFNGHSWDGNPFSCCPLWLPAAIARGDVMPEPDDRDYSPFRVKTKEGDVIAYCGDRIGFDGEHLYVKRAA